MANERKLIRSRVSSFRGLGKKAQAQELLLYGVILFVFGITILIGFRLITDINDQFQKNDLISQTGKDGLQGFTDRYGQVFDAAYAMAVVLLSIVLIATVVMIDTHPVFFVLSVVSFLAVMLVNAILANVLDDTGSQSQLAVFYDQLPLMQFFAQHWLAVITVVGFVSLLIFYSKRVAN